MRPDPAAYASSEDAARLIGSRTGRIIRQWMGKAGYEAIPNAGYRVADLCAVLNAHPWPHQFRVTPEHFRTVPAVPGNAPENAADAAVSDDAGNPALARLSGLLAALEAQNAALARVEAELAAQRERAATAEAERRALLDEVRVQGERRAADAAATAERLDGLAGEVAALTQRRAWWARLLRRG